MDIRITYAYFKAASVPFIRINCHIEAGQRTARGCSLNALSTTTYSNSLNRLQRGVVYERGKSERALENFFREETLVALRELALRQAAHEVEHRIVEGETRPLSPDGILDRVSIIRSWS